MLKQSCTTDMMTSDNLQDNIQPTTELFFLYLFLTNKKQHLYECINKKTLITTKCTNYLTEIKKEKTEYSQKSNTEFNTRTSNFSFNTIEAKLSTLIIKFMSTVCSL